MVTKLYNYIYKITNLVNKKIYIGKHSTDNMNDSYMGSGRLIKQAESKYGINNFSKEIIAFTDNLDRLNFLEKFYIKKYRSKDLSKGYNLTDGGEGTLGKFYDKDYRKRLSEGAKRRYEKDSSTYGFTGKHWTEEQKKHLSELKKGKKRKPFSEEHKNNMSLSQKGKSKPKYRWLTPIGEIKIMNMSNAHKYHPDWVKIEVVR